jgi:hypothetical protein
MRILVNFDHRDTYSRGCSKPAGHPQSKMEEIQRD